MDYIYIYIYIYIYQEPYILYYLARSQTGANLVSFEIVFSFKRVLRASLHGGGGGGPQVGEVTRLAGVGFAILKLAQNSLWW